MSDATYIELPPQKKKRPPLLRGWRAIAVLLGIAIVCAAGYFSWWLAQGRLSSAFARVDTTVYTVEAAYPTTVEQLLVHSGEEVAAGQPLARIDTRAMEASLRPQAPVQDEISGRLNAAQDSERKMAARVAQARAEEERYKKIHQQRVTEHVRAQLAMRTHAGRSSWDQASRDEAATRARMDAARDDFERISRMRAALDAELGRIRYDLARRKRSGIASAPDPAPQTPAPAPVPIDNTLYAPAQGKVISVNARPGDPLDRGQAIFVILPNGPDPNKWVQAWFHQSDQNLLEIGQKALVHTPESNMRGTLTAMGEPQSLQLEGGGTGLFIPVKINVDDQEELAKLAPGSRVDCQIQTRYLLGETFFF